MKLRVEPDYDFPDTKKWILYNGERYEGDIVWYDGTSTEHEQGFHLEMMEVGDEGNDFNEWLQDAGVFATFDEAFKSAEAHR